MKVFISYADQDAELAGGIAHRLRHAGLGVWTAAEVLPGDNWARKMGEALDESNAMVALVSPEWADSRWVRDEIAYVVGSPRYAGRLIPVLVRPTDDAPWILRRMQAIDGTQDVERISQQILDRLQQPVS